MLQYQLDSINTNREAR